MVFGFSKKQQVRISLLGGKILAIISKENEVLDLLSSALILSSSAC